MTFLLSVFKNVCCVHFNNSVCENQYIVKKEYIKKLYLFSIYILCYLIIILYMLYLNLN